MASILRRRSQARCWSRRVGARLRRRRPAGCGHAASGRAGVGGIDAELLDGIDRLQHALDLRPAGDAQQDFAAGTDEGTVEIGFAGRDGAQDVDARDDGAEVVRRPADVGEDRCPARSSGCGGGDRGSVSATSRPKRIQCSIRFSSQINSTWVSASGEQGVPCEGGDCRSWLSSIGCGEFAGEQVRAACRRRSGRAGRRRP